MYLMMTQLILNGHFDRKLHLNTLTKTRQAVNKQHVCHIQIGSLATHVGTMLLWPLKAAITTLTVRIITHQNVNLEKFANE